MLPARALSGTPESDERVAKVDAQDGETEEAHLDRAAQVDGEVRARRKTGLRRGINEDAHDVGREHALGEANESWPHAAIEGKNARVDTRARAGQQLPRRAPNGSVEEDHGADVGADPLARRVDEKRSDPGPRLIRILQIQNRVVAAREELRVGPRRKDEQYTKNECKELHDRLDGAQSATRSDCRTLRKTSA